MPIKIYEAIKEENPIKAKRLIRNIDKKLLCILTELVLQLTAGNSEIESELSKLVIDDLEILSKQSDEVFINQILLRLFKLEKTLPVSLTQKTDNLMRFEPMTE